MEKLLNKKIDNLSYEEAFERLQEIINLLEQGNVSLDDSIKYYEQGMPLRKIQETLLEEINYNVSHSKINRWAKKEGWQRPKE